MSSTWSRHMRLATGTLPFAGNLGHKLLYKGGKRGKEGGEERKGKRERKKKGGGGGGRRERKWREI